MREKPDDKDILLQGRQPAIRCERVNPGPLDRRSHAIWHRRREDALNPNAGANNSEDEKSDNSTTCNTSPG